MSLFYVFSNGKILATGSKTFEDGCKAVAQMVATLKKLGYQASMSPIIIVNLIAKIDMTFPIAIKQIIVDPYHKRYCVAQGGKFSCVNYRIKVIQPQMTVVFFPNGKVLFQSAKSLTSLREAVVLMVPVISTI